MTAVLPPARVAIAGTAPPSREWYRYFQAAMQVNLDVGTLQHDVDALTVRVTALEDVPPSGGDTKISGVGSIYVSATAVKVVSLNGDVDDPGFTAYYGTDATGEKGWYAVGDALASSGNVTKTTDAAGVTSFDLVGLADSGTGVALVKITRDAKGRVSGTSAATTTDLTEGDNLYFTDERAQDAVGAALDGTGDVPLTYDDAGNKISAALSVGAQASLAKANTALQPDDMPPGYIDGLKMVWVSGTALTVTSGSAYIPGTSAVLAAPADIAKTGLSLSASTWYHVYLYDNAGTPAVEVVTTAPAAPYNGTARSKTGNTSRRYVGSVLTDASAAICKFAQSGESVMYETSIAPAPFLVVSTGRATTVTNVACAGCVPLTARIGVLIMATVNATADAAVGNSDMVGTLSGSNYLQYVGSGVQTTHLMPLDSSQRFSYVMTGTTSTGGFFARVAGYVMER